jgi:hypothetical protein
MQILSINLGTKGIKELDYYPIIPTLSLSKLNLNPNRIEVGLIAFLFSLLMINPMYLFHHSIIISMVIPSISIYHIILHHLICFRTPSTHIDSCKLNKLFFIGTRSPTNLGVHRPSARSFPQEHLR